MADKLVGFLNNGDATPHNKIVKGVEEWLSMDGVPGVNEDVDHGFAVGRLMLNRLNHTVYECRSAAVGAASWVALSAPAGQVLPTDYVAQYDVQVASAPATPAPITLTVNTVLGRVAGVAKALTKAEQRQNILTASEAETNLLVGPNSIGPSRFVASPVFNAVDTAPALTTAQLMNGVILGQPSVARAYTTPTGAAIIAALPGAVSGTGFEFTVVNTGANTATLTAGDANVTFVGSASIVSGTFIRYRCVVSAGLAAVVIYRLTV